MTTHTVNYENSGEAESDHNAKDHSETEIHDDEEEKVEVVAPPVNDQAVEANRTLTKNKKSQLQYKQLIQAGEDIFLNWRN